MKPVRTSTPKIGVRKITARKSIHEPPIPSPINTKNDKFEYEKKENDDSENEDSDESDDDVHDKKKLDEQKERKIKSVKVNERKSIEKKVKIVNNQNEIKNRINYLCFVHKFALTHIIFVLIVALGILFPLNGETKNVKELNVKDEINKLMLNYPNQHQNLWISIISSSKEVLRFNKPSVIVLLYLENQERTINNLIFHISQIANKILNESEDNLLPIVIKGSDLNTKEYQRDFGSLIEEYKLLLEERHILAVKNLEDVLPSVSQAFHVICDEYSPLVEKAFILFSVKVKEFIGKEVEQAGNVLRDAWKDLEEDKLEPLIARVTNLVIKVNWES